MGGASRDRGGLRRSQQQSAVEHMMTAVVPPRQTHERDDQLGLFSA